MRKYNISANLVRTIEQLYDKATSAVQVNGSIEEWFRTTVGVRQIKLVKILHELTESEPKVYPKHQRERWTNTSPQTIKLQVTS